MTIRFSTLLLLSIFTILIGCQADGPSEINFGKDQCDHCRMTIEEKGYATELMTNKGRAYKFDDIDCMNKFVQSNTDKSKDAKTYVIDFKTAEFLETDKAIFIQGGEIKSPMGGNTQAYANPKDAENAANELGAPIVK